MELMSDIFIAGSVDHRVRANILDVYPFFVLMGVAFHVRFQFPRLSILQVYAFSDDLFFGRSISAGLLPWMRAVGDVSQANIRPLERSLDSKSS